MINKKIQLAGIVSVAILSFGPLTAARSADAVVGTSSIMTACKLFEIDSNAGLLTAAQRVQMIQVRLDHALINAKDLTPSAVRVGVINNNPVVTLDKYMIVTADGNSATRNRTTRMALAEKWADSLRMCLSDSAAIQRYIAMLTGKFPTAKDMNGVLTRDEIAVLTPDTLIPLKLLSPISAETAQIGDVVEAVVSNDVPLGPSYTSYLPAGTIALGEIVSAHKYTNNDYAGKEAFSVNFFKLRTPDAKEIPIEGHFLGGLDKWRMIHIQPITAESCSDGPLHAIATTVEAGVPVLPAKGYVVGAWRGKPLDEMQVDNYPRLIFTRNSEVVVNAGECMLLKFTSNTTIALAGKRQFVSVLTETH